jgi:hypothetical protein
MIVEPPYSLNTPDDIGHAQFRWRHMMYEVVVFSGCCNVLTIHWTDKHVAKAYDNTELGWIRYGRFVLLIIKQ